MFLSLIFVVFLYAVVQGFVRVVVFFWEWLSRGRQLDDAPSALRLFIEGILLQISNPALIIFYLSLFPQCIDPALSYWPQVILLSVNYSLILLVIHSIYGAMASGAAERFLSDSASVWINRASGAAYWLLALGFGIPMMLGTI